MRAAQIVRKDILQTQYKFNGSLTDKQYSKQPASLITLVQMILGGTNIKNQAENNNEINNVVISLSELMTFNTVKRRGPNQGGSVRHSLDRETPLPLYLGLLVHNKTRKRDIVDKLFGKGLSVSYDRVLQLSTDAANNVIDQYEHDGIVCPTSLRDGLFTTGNLDNIDHNTSSTASQDSFHGTAISLTQHVTQDKCGTVRNTERVQVATNLNRSKTIKPLPASYNDVPPAQFPNEKLSPPLTVESVIPNSLLVDSDDEQKAWLMKVNSGLQENSDIGDNVSWSAHFASLQDQVRPSAITGLMPLFRDCAHSLAMIKHGMDLIARATELVHPGQVPVMTVDQPLYAIAKKVQWTWPNTYGEDKYVVMLGGLHIEMATLSMIGDWLSGSGWSTVMTSANVTTEGRVDGIQRGSQTSRAQWAHQVSAAALYTLRKEAYDTYKENTDVDVMLSFSDWCKGMESQHPQFCYWNMTLQLENLFLAQLRSQRSANFDLYVEVLGKIIPWMFALDHYHYSRWLTVHVRDLVKLEQNCPSIHQDFFHGSFVTQKTCHKFSALAHDHVHEQLNAMVKGEGGAVGLTENESALRRWMVAGPEISWMLTEYEQRFTKKTPDEHHHEQIPSIQKAFLTDVYNVVNVINGHGNPFADQTTELFTLDTNIIMSGEVIQTT